MRLKNKTIIISALLITGGIYTLTPKDLNSRNDIKTDVKQNKVTIPEFIDMTNDLISDNKINIEEYLKENMPEGFNVNIFQQDNDIAYEANFEDHSVYITSDTGNNNVTRIQYLVNQNKRNNENSLIYIYSNPLNGTYLEEEFKNLTEDEKLMIKKSTFIAICELYDYNSFNNIFKTIKSKTPLSQTFYKLINKIKDSEDSILLKDAMDIIGEKESSIIETTEYDEDCIVDTKTYEFKNDNSSLYIGVESKSNKVWAIEYTEDKENIIKTFTFKNRPFINSSNNVQFYIRTSSDSIKNIKNAINSISKEVL